MPMGKQGGTKRFRREGDAELADPEVLTRLGIEFSETGNMDDQARQILDRLADATTRLSSDMKHYRASLKRAVADGDRMLAKALR